MSSNRPYSCGLLQSFSFFDRRLSIPLPFRRCGQIDAADQQRKLLASQLYAALIGCWPMQSPLFHAARADPKAVVVEKENLHAISSRIGKQKQMAALRVL